MKKTIQVRETKEVEVCDRCGAKRAARDVEIISQSQQVWAGEVCYDCYNIIMHSTERRTRKRRAE